MCSIKVPVLHLPLYFVMARNHCLMKSMSTDRLWKLMKNHEGGQTHEMNRVLKNLSFSFAL